MRVRHTKTTTWFEIERDHQPIEVAWQCFNHFNARRGAENAYNAKVFLIEARRRIDAMNAKWASSQTREQSD